MGGLGGGVDARGAGFAALDAGCDGFDLRDRHGGAGLELEEAAQREDLLHRVVHQAGVDLEGLVVAGAHGLLEAVDDLRAEEVGFAFVTPLVVAADSEGRGGLDALGVGLLLYTSYAADVLSRVRISLRRAIYITSQHTMLILTMEQFI